MQYIFYDIESKEREEARETRMDVYQCFILSMKKTEEKKEGEEK